MAKKRKTEEMSLTARRRGFAAWQILGGIVLILGGVAGFIYWNWVHAVNLSIDALERGDTVGALNLAKDALGAAPRELDKKSMLTTLRLITNIYACRRQFGAAEFWNGSAQDYDRKAFGKDSVEMATEYAGLALFRRKRQKFRDSEELYRDAIAIYEKYPEEAAECARVKALLAWDLIQLKRYDEARSYLHQSNDVLRKQFGNESFELLVGLVEGAYLKKLEEDASWHADLQLAYTMITEPKDLAKSSAQTVVVLNLMAQMLQDSNEDVKSLKTFQIAEANCKSSVFGGRYNLYMADILVPQSKLLVKMGRQQEADALMVLAADVRKVPPVPDYGYNPSIIH